MERVLSLHHYRGGRYHIFVIGFNFPNGFSYEQRDLEICFVTDGHPNGIKRKRTQQKQRKQISTTKKATKKAIK